MLPLSQLVLSGVLCWGLVTHFILVSFVFVFGCHIYVTLHGMCFSLYIGTAHYSILQFPVFVYPLVNMFCSHYVLQVATLQALDGPSLVELSNLDTLLITYLCHVQQLVLFDVSYTFIDSKFRVIFAFSWFWNLCSLSKFICMNWLVLLKLQN